MSLTKLPLSRNISAMTSLFPPRESLVVTSRLGTGNSRSFFYGAIPTFIYCDLYIPSIGLHILLQENRWTDHGNIQGGSDKSGFFFFFLLNGAAQLKTSRFYWSKKNLQRYTLTINIFNKTTVSCAESLDPGPEARAGLHQGVPGKEPHHLLHLLNQITGLVQDFALALYSETPHTKQSKRLQSGELGGQTSSSYTPTTP